MGGGGTKGERGGYTWRTVSRHKKKHLAAPFGAVFDTCAHRLPTKTGNEKISSQARPGSGGGQVEVVRNRGGEAGELAIKSNLASIFKGNSLAAFACSPSPSPLTFYVCAANRAKRLQIARLIGMQRSCRVHQTLPQCPGRPERGHFVLLAMPRFVGVGHGLL